MSTEPALSTTDTALYVGLISGTSTDGIDTALCRFEPQVELLHARTHAWPEPLRERILELSQGTQSLDLDAYGRLDVAAGQCFAEAVQALLREADTPPAAVRAIGSHGQTVRHRIEGRQPFTLQIGDASVIAERTGIDTVADFRRADVAAGGQGAPLMPAFHAALLGGCNHVRAVLNLGGIANLSMLHPDGTVTGFDSGPANGLMDAWCVLNYGQPYDRDGMIAARGNVHEKLLDDLLADPYFALAAPKSTGREYFHLEWLYQHGDIHAMEPADVQATLMALTVRSIADAMQRDGAKAEQIVVCGGGVHNSVLMQALAQTLAPQRVLDSTMLGLAPDHVEAMGFAWLAYRRLHGEPGNLPMVTGAAGLRLLGTLHAAPPQAGRCYP